MEVFRNRYLVAPLVFVCAVLVALYSISAGVCYNTLHNGIIGNIDPVRCILYTCLGIHPIGADKQVLGIFGLLLVGIYLLGVFLISLVWKSTKDEA